jgi:hypothetical protein
MDSTAEHTTASPTPVQILGGGAAAAFWKIPFAR